MAAAGGVLHELGQQVGVDHSETSLEVLQGQVLHVAASLCLELQLLLKESLCLLFHEVYGGLQVDVKVGAVELGC